MAKTLLISRWTLLVLLPAAIATLTALAAAHKGQAKTNYFFVAIFAGLVLAFLQVFGEVKAWRASRTAATAKTALADALAQSGHPLVIQAGRVASARTDDDRRAAINTLISMTVGIAYLQCGRLAGIKCSTRSVYYRFVSEGHLVRHDFAGRTNRAPRQDFLASRNDNDRQVINVARGEQALLITNVEKAPPRDYSDYEGRPYLSFLVVPVRTEQKSYGFLSVDSDKADTLTEADVGYIRLMAGLIAASIALLDGDFPDLGRVPSVPVQTTPQVQTTQGGTQAQPTP